MLKDFAIIRNKLVGSEIGIWGHSKEQLYYDTIGLEFNLASFFSYFHIIHPQRSVYNFTEPDEELSFAQQNQLKLISSGLIFWWSDPAWVKALPKSNLKLVLQNHIKKVLGRYKGMVRYWTVVNENLTKNPTTIPWAKMSADPLEYVRVAFRTARAADPAARLLYNDTGFEFGGTRTDKIFNALKKLRTQSTPIDGIGFQCHFKVEIAANLPNLLTKFDNTIKRFRGIGLTPFITELDVAIPKTSAGPTPAQLDDQKRIYESIITKAFENEVRVVCLWGFTDKYSWIDTAQPNFGYACVLDSNYNKKPAYFGVENAIVNA